MRTTIEKLVETPLMTAELVTTKLLGEKQALKLNWVMSSAYDGKKMIGTTGTEYDLTPEALDCLAEQFQLASLQIRAIIADMDPGRRFEADKALAFGTERLEGDIPQVEG